MTLAQNAHLIAFDIDELMMNKAKLLIEIRDNEQGTNIGTRIEYVRGNYADIVFVLHDRKADFILNDLGVNLEHFKAVERGFSIRGIAPLDMRFDTTQAKSAATLLATYSSDQLRHLFEHYADFSSAKALELAQHIVTTRKQKPIITTQDLKLILNTC